MGAETSKPTLEELKNREIQRVDREMRRKMQKGVQYNMKVVIRGDRNTGKTCLMKRLKGQPFSQAYLPSEQISTAHIHWNYKASDDTVVVEVWDVVDQGKLKKSESAKDLVQDPHAASLKGENFYDGEDDDDDDDEDEIDATQSIKKKSDVLSQKVSEFQQQQQHTDGSHKLTALDASMIDVYKHTNAVIMIFDITKKWTFDYVKREIQKVPKHIDIVILANCLDLGDNRVVTSNEIDTFIQTCLSKEKSNLLKRDIRCIECSMKNCFGLKQLYTYFNIPFLKLKIGNLKRQIEMVEEEFRNSLQEVDLTISEQSYDNYLKFLKETRKKAIPFTEEVIGNRKPISTNNAHSPQSPATSQMHTHLPSKMTGQNDSKTSATQQTVIPNNKQQSQLKLENPETLKKKNQEVTNNSTAPSPQDSKSLRHQKSGHRKRDPRKAGSGKTNTLEEFAVGIDSSFFGENEVSEGEDTYASTAITTQTRDEESVESDELSERPLKDADIDEEDLENYTYSVNTMTAATVKGKSSTITDVSINSQGTTIDEDIVSDDVDTSKNTESKKQTLSSPPKESNTVQKQEVNAQVSDVQSAQSKIDQQTDNASKVDSFAVEIDDDAGFFEESDNNENNINNNMDENPKEEISKREETSPAPSQTQNKEGQPKLLTPINRSEPSSNEETQNVKKKKKKPTTTNKKPAKTKKGETDIPDGDKQKTKKKSKKKTNDSHNENIITKDEDYTPSVGGYDPI